MRIPMTLPSASFLLIAGTVFAEGPETAASTALIALGTDTRTPTVRTVCPGGSADFLTIQEAIDNSMDGDTILLCDDTFSGAGNRSVFCRGLEVVVRSASGNPDLCVVDCEGGPENEHRGFAFEEGEGPGAVLEGITITNGYRVGGAGVLVRHSSPSIRNCVFLNNEAEDGGALQVIDTSDVLVENCRFENNTAAFYGGGVDVEYSSIVIRDCVFLLNSSELCGGGVASFQSETRLEGCTFIENESAGGGGICAYLPGTAPIVERCTFYGNSAPTGGGMVAANGAILDVENTIVAYSATGAAVACVSDGAVSISCSDLYGNAGGNWVGCIAGQSGLNGNISADPIFCNAASSDFTIRNDSPCKPSHNPACGLIGAWPVGCYATDVATGEIALDRPALYPPTPNPFADATAISFRIPGQSSETGVSVGIYDVSGRLVRLLENSRVTDGTRTLTWDGLDGRGRQAASGVYFCRMRCGEADLSRRLVLLR